MDGGGGGGGGKAKHGETLLDFANSVVFRSLSDAAPFLDFSGDTLFRIACRSVLLSIYILICILALLLSYLPRLPPFCSRSSPDDGLLPRGDSTCTARALSHVLSAVVGVPIASRKYHLIRSLAERILEDNLRYCDGGDPGLCDLNRVPLCTSFASTIGLLEEAIAARRPDREAAPWSGPAGPILGVLRSVAGSWAAAAGEEAEPDRRAEKLVAEALWLGQKMAESGAAAEAVMMWGKASGLAALALSAEPRLQVEFVRVCVFMIKQANPKTAEAGEKGGKEAINSASSHMALALLSSWLPLLCRAPSGVDGPALSGREKAETLLTMEDMIARLSWEKQEVILSLWLHHFTASPDSDWPNLQSCYVRWYSESRKIDGQLDTSQTDKLFL